MSSVAKSTFLLANDYYYEPLDRYPPVESDYHDLMQELLPDDWRIIRQGVWFHAVPSNKETPAQGWKIHLSATPTNAQDILRQIVPVLVGDRVAFKFALDRRILGIMNGKGWHRGGAGKFVTIYPQNEAHFVDLIERLHQVTSQFSGPYILSDRRYRGSRVVYYRYGGLAPIKTVTSKGDPQHTLTTPDGETINDERQAYFVLPSWVKDPFETPAEASGEQEASLKDGRYLITKAVAFSNSGGVYLATDRQNDRTVLIKEARPLTNFTPTGEDAVALLEREYRLLKKVAGTGIGPEPYDFFQDWEHSYLVEEYLGDVLSLRYFAAGRAAANLVLSTSPTRRQVKNFLEDFKKIFGRVAELLGRLHDHGIVFMDLSMNNILVLNDDLELRLIDFESAFEPSTESPAYLFTPGFASLTDLNSKKLGFASDYYGLGALMMSFVMPINGMMSYDSKAPFRFLRSICSDFGLPPELIDLIQRLMSREPTERPRPAEVVAALEELKVTTARPPRIKPSKGLKAACAEVVAGTLAQLDKVRSPDRSDRLFPADPKMFVSNPLSLGYGAGGVAYAIKKLSGKVPQQVVDWILLREVTAGVYAPGLYLGMAGVAWTLHEIGQPERALEMLRLSETHPQLESSPDMFYGLAGWGLTQLKFHHVNGDRHHLNQALWAGDRLLEKATEEGGHLCWPDGEEGVPLGFGHGASGISLFLLYLHLASGEQRYLTAGQRALDFDLAAPDRNLDGVATWRIRQSPRASMLPYFRFGTAGVGTAALRYYWHTRDSRYRDALAGMLPDLSRKYAIFPGRFVGLTGMGELLIDLSVTPGFEESAKAALERLISGVLLFRVDSVDGLSFPGYELFRLSSDIGTGSTGIALFLDRYLKYRHADFLLDELFPGGALGAASRLSSPVVAEKRIEELSEVLV